MVEELVSIEGVNETIAALSQIRDEMPAEVTLALYEALAPIEDAVTTYPPQPPSMVAPGHRFPTKPYIRTGNYGRTTYIGTGVDGNDWVGYVNSPVDYAYWIRGDGKDYEGAWMHRPFWESLIAIKGRLMPKALDILRSRIQEFVQKVMGK